MKHRHHIVPKHAGGEDKSFNLIFLSIKEHAEAHRVLYEKNKDWRDYLAWKGLAKLIFKEEIVHILQSEATKERLRVFGNPFKGRKTKANFFINEEQRKKAFLLSQTDESQQKLKESLHRIKHQQGQKNSQYGRSWYVREEAKNTWERKKFFLGSIPRGWITVPEWRNNHKDKTKGSYGRGWYNNGYRNYFLLPEESLVPCLAKGRI